MNPPRPTAVSEFEGLVSLAEEVDPGLATAMKSWRKRWIEILGVPRTLDRIMIEEAKNPGDVLMALQAADLEKLTKYLARNGFIEFSSRTDGNGTMQLGIRIRCLRGTPKEIST